MRRVSLSSMRASGLRCLAAAAGWRNRWNKGRYDWLIDFMWDEACSIRPTAARLWLNSANHNCIVFNERQRGIQAKAISRNKMKRATTMKRKRRRRWREEEEKRKKAPFDSIDDSYLAHRITETGRSANNNMPNSNNAHSEPAYIYLCLCTEHVKLNMHIGLCRYTCTPACM